MIKKLLFILCVSLSNVSFAAVETTFAGDLPEGVSNQLDKLTSGAMGTVIIQKLCYNQKEEVTLKEVNRKVSAAIEKNLSGQYLNNALLYASEAMDQKRKAFKFVYADKTCADLKNLKDIALGVGFKN